MKILIINKFHYLRGGSERAVFDLAKLLEDNGHEVINFSMQDEKNIASKYDKYFIKHVNLEKFNLINVIKFFYNYQAVGNLKKLIKDKKPDVAHLHNIAHQFSPAIIKVLKNNNIPVVQTLHDYKLICPNSKLYSRNEICERCLGGKYYKCFLRKCMHGSRLKSLLGMLEAYLNNKILKYYEQVDLFIAPSIFLKSKYEEFGIKNKIVYLANPLTQKIDKKNIFETTEKYILYFGRLTPEKGIDILIKAYANLHTEFKLYILGDGPMKKDLEFLTKNLGIADRVNFISYKSGQELQKIKRRAEFIVVPSLWYENAPYSVIEAMAMGKTVIASELGGLKEMIRHGVDGFLYKADDITELTKIMEYVISHPELKNTIGSQAIKSVSLKNDPQKYYTRLFDAYKLANIK